MQLEVGKTYLDRSGNKVKIVRDYHDYRLYTFEGDSGYTYQATGNRFSHSGCNDDLISEYIEKPKLQLEVGKSYVNRDGQIVHIRKFRYDDTTYKFESSDNQTFTPEGLRFIHTKHYSDLIAEAPSNPAKPSLTKLKPSRLYSMLVPLSGADDLDELYISLDGVHVAIGDTDILQADLGTLLEALTKLRDTYARDCAND